MTLRTMLSLFSIAGFCGCLLVATDALTHNQIQANREAQDRAVIESMLDRPLATRIDLYAERFADCGNFEAMRMDVAGYAAVIEMLIVRHLDADTAAVRVLRHLETPGIGDFIDHRKDAWISHLDGLARHEIVAFDGVTGATVTSNAVREGLRKALTEMVERPLECIPSQTSTGEGA